MRRHYRALALAISLAAIPATFAQQNAATANPVARAPGGEVFFYGPLDGQSRSQAFGRGIFDDNTGIGRPHRSVPVTPVPEPSQWAMMLAGLALVGFVVRRNARGNNDAN
jgi:hypothetical protein